MEKSRGDPEFAGALAHGLGGINFKSLDEGFKKIVWKKTGEDPEFAAALATFMCVVIQYFDEPLQRSVLRKAEENTEFRYWLNVHLGNWFPLIGEKMQKDIWELAELNDQFAVLLADSLCMKFLSFDNALQEKITDKIGENDDHEFMIKLTQTLVYQFTTDENLCHAMLGRAEIEDTFCKLLASERWITLPNLGTKIARGGLCIRH